MKAESDVCCTSSNAVKIVNGMGSDRVLCIPDEYLAQNVAREADVDVIAWKGRCEVHELFTAEELQQYREDDPGLKIIAHPECKPDVLDEADFSGSTSAMTCKRTPGSCWQRPGQASWTPFSSRAPPVTPRRSTVTAWPAASRCQPVTVRARCRPAPASG